MSNLQPLEFKECVIDSPWFRDKLLLHERELNNSVRVFKDIYNSIKNVYKTLEDCSVAFKQLAVNLTKFTPTDDRSEYGNGDIQAETQDEKKIRCSVKMYSDLINNIEAMRQHHLLSATKDLVMNDLQKLKDDCLSRSKQDIKDFKKTTATYYMKLDKYSAIKYKQDGEYESVDAEFQEDRRIYVRKALAHVMNIQEIEEQKTCKLVHTVSLMIQMLNTYHHQAWDYFGDQKKKIDDVNCALYRTEESYTCITKDSEKLKQQLLTIPIEHIQPDSKIGGESRREGYLFVFTKKSLMSDCWTRKFCTYEKNSKILTIFHTIQSSQNSAQKIQNEELQLISCERKKSSLIDRRFSFDVNVTNQQFPLTLQALTKEDLTQWMLIMDGKEPVYALPRAHYNEHEPETVLNDRVMRFLSMCFSEIERRGIDTVGIYRICGRQGVRDTLLKKLIADVNNTSSDVVSTRELELIELNTLCSIVKAYIKYLKIPMATYDLYDEFIAAGKMQNPSERFDAVSNVIKKLPPDHFRLFTIVMQHLNRITHHQEKNMMTAPNLGVCFSPTIFRPEQGNASLTAIRESKFAADVISLLIECCDIFFPPSNQQPSLSSKSMCVARVDKGGTHQSPERIRMRNEQVSAPTNIISPKPALKRHQTELFTSDVRPQSQKPPPILAPKPDVSKISTKLLAKFAPTVVKSDISRAQSTDAINIKRTLPRAKTLYLFVAENDSQLSFDPNKIATNVGDSENNGWLIATIDGRVGLIPKSHVEILPS